MTDTTACFPNLNNSNYVEWSIWMEAILVWQGLCSMVKILISGVDAEGVVYQQLWLSWAKQKRSKMLERWMRHKQR